MQTSSATKTSTPKSSLGNVSNGAKEGKAESKSPSPALSQDNVSVGGSGENKGRQSTPDIIKDNNRKTVLENGFKLGTVTEALSVQVRLS